MIFVTSDLHACRLNVFTELLDKAGYGISDTCYILGDLIDRGENCAELLDFVMSRPDMKLLRGNHEQMLLTCRFLFDDNSSKLTTDDMHTLNNWIFNGGQTTLDAIYEYPKEKRKLIFEYMGNTPLYEKLSVNGQDFILTHSGLGNFSPDKKLSDYTEEELLWNRPLCDTRYFENITTIFGHTPTIMFGPSYKGRAYITDTWIDIDTGVAAGFDPALLCLDTMEIFYREVKEK